jgi:hypothetical protein
MINRSINTLSKLPIIIRSKWPNLPNHSKSLKIQVRCIGTGGPNSHGNAHNTHSIGIYYLLCLAVSTGSVALIWNKNKQINLNETVLKMERTNRTILNILWIIKRLGDRTIVHDSYDGNIHNFINKYNTMGYWIDKSKKILPSDIDNDEIERIKIIVNYAREIAGEDFLLNMYLCDVLVLHRQILVDQKLEILKYIDKGICTLSESELNKIFDDISKKYIKDFTREFYDFMIKPSNEYMNKLIKIMEIINDL